MSIVHYTNELKMRTAGYLIFFFYLVFNIPSYSIAQNVVPAFTIPDTVCVNAPVNITNNSTGASSYFWNFCVADINALPTAVNLGNTGGYLSQPVFVDLVQDNGSYYGFVVNHVPGGITRLDFGNSLLNTPTAVYLGNISGVMNAGYGSEGIQVIKTNGKWYGVLVGGSPLSGANSVPKLITIYFGANVNNPAPTAVSWGNLGNMLQAVDLHVFQENNNWYGFTVNAENSTITRFNFTNSFDNPPTAVNLGNLGNLDYPTGVYAINDNGTWRVFVANQGVYGGIPSVSRLDFGNTLLNTPTGTNLGNPGNLLTSARDITILKLCGQSVGFVVNANNNIVRLNFNDLSGIPTATSLGNIGSLSFPHSLSKLFRAGNDIYSLITNVTSNTITRLKFTGCSTSSVPSASIKDPTPVTYNAPGTYNITLTVDDGLPTQNAVCKQVVVLAPPVHSPTRSLSLCRGTSIRIGSSVHPATYTWSTGAVSDSIVLNSPGTYWVESARYGCAVRDSFIVSSPSGPAYDCDSIKITGADKVCSGADTLTYAVYRPAGCTQQYIFQADASLATVVAQTPNSIRLLFRQNGIAKLKVAYTNNCKTIADSMNVSVKFSPASVNLGPDISTCKDTGLVLHAGSGFNTYLWQNGTTDSTLQVHTAGMYSVTAQNNCSVQFKDTLTITGSFRPPFGVSPLTAAACVGDSLQFTASGGTSYAWLPAGSFDHANTAAPKALVHVSQSFTLTITDSICVRDTVITIPVTAMPEPQISIIKSNDITCKSDSAVLTATGGVSYIWSPDLYVSNNLDAKIIVRPPAAVTYHVSGKNASGCSGQDSVHVLYVKEGDQKLYVPNAFTPNRNGSNDVFRPLFTGPTTKYDFVIYNRWGHPVFKADTPNIGWDGTFHGVPQPQGTYVYIVIAEGACNDTFKQKGTFVLLR